MRGIIFLVVVLLCAGFASAACTYSPQCSPNVQQCGCGGSQTRYTLCNGGCSQWYQCSVNDKESICSDSTDNDCDGKLDCADSDCSDAIECVDSDRDSYPASIDCDDNNPNIHPGAVELCNNIDDNCNDVVDESLSRECGKSSVGICRLGTEVCRSGAWQGCDAVLPGRESCNGLDDDCNGQVDEGCSCTDGERQRCGSDVGACKYGSQLCVKGNWSLCTGGIIPKSEICNNGVDDDCDGNIDEDCVTQIPVSQPVVVQNTSVKPQVVSNVSNISPVIQKPKAEIPVCIDRDGDTYGNNCSKGADCDDDDASIHPGAVEICNNLDDDCNGFIDENMSRRCGISDIGICTYSAEQCIAGNWSGCNAVLPSKEVCDNGLDENCNGAVDEDCNAKQVTGEELALKQFLDLEKGTGKYNLDDYIEKFRKTKDYVNVEKTSVIVDGRTRVRLQIVPIETLHNLTVYEYIPKFVAHSADMIVFTTKPEIIQSDPLVAWHFAVLSEKVDLSYEIKGEVPGAASKTSTLSFADEITPKVRPWYFDYIPLLIIPVVGFVFIFLVEIAHRRRGQ